MVEAILIAAHAHVLAVVLLLRRPAVEALGFAGLTIILHVLEPPRCRGAGHLALATRPELPLARQCLCVCVSVCTCEHVCTPRLAHDMVRVCFATPPQSATSLKSTHFLQKGNGQDKFAWE